MDTMVPSDIITTREVASAKSKLLHTPVEISEYEKEDETTEKLSTSVNKAMVK